MISWLAWIGGLVAVGIWAAVLVDARRTNRHSQGYLALPGDDCTAVRWIIVLAWTYSVVPSLIGLLQRGRQDYKVGNLAVVTALEARLSTVLAIAIAGLCIHLIFVHMKRPPAAGLFRLAAFIAPWFGLEVIAAVGAGYSAGRQLLLYPLIAVALWLASPPLRVASTLGWLTIGTALFSLLFALLSPLAFVNAGLAGSDKAIIFRGPLLLAGPYDAPNTLGLCLALGVPAAILVRPVRARMIGLVLIGVALLWSAGRTSILAASMIIAVYLVSRGRSVRALRATGLLVIVIGVFLVSWTPFAERNPLAFSQRGVIWMTSLAMWRHHRWLGAGPKFYERPNSLGFYALYGHNLVVDTLIRGGLVAMMCIVVWGLVLLRQSVRLAPVSAFPLLMIVGLVYTSWLEVPVAFDNIGAIGYTCWLPLALAAFTRDGVAPGDVLRRLEAAVAPQARPAPRWNGAHEAL